MPGWGWLLVGIGASGLCGVVGLYLLLKNTWPG